jgi:hypothetical protein
MYRVGQYSGAGKQDASNEFNEGEAQVEKKRPGNIALAGGWRVPRILFCVRARPMVMVVVAVHANSAGDSSF